MIQWSYHDLITLQKSFFLIPSHWGLTSEFGVGVQTLMEK